MLTLLSLALLLAQGLCGEDGPHYGPPANLSAPTKVALPAGTTARELPNGFQNIPYPYEALRAPITPVNLDEVAASAKSYPPAAYIGYGVDMSNIDSAFDISSMTHAVLRVIQVFDLDKKTHKPTSVQGVDWDVGKFLGLRASFVRSCFKALFCPTPWVFGKALVMQRCSQC